jgi:hypothetical protein
MTIERKEIPKRIKLEVLIRAGGPENPRCEGDRDGEPGVRCGLPLKGKRFHYDHDTPEWLRTTPKKQRKPITANDVRLLGWDCCHKPKTAREAGERAKDYAVFEKHNGLRAKRKSRPMPFGRDSKLKKKITGEIVER